MRQTLNTLGTQFLIQIETRDKRIDERDWNMFQNELNSKCKVLMLLKTRVISKH